MSGVGVQPTSLMKPSETAIQSVRTSGCLKTGGTRSGSRQQLEGRLVDSTAATRRTSSVDRRQLLHHLRADQELDSPKVGRDKGTEAIYGVGHSVTGEGERKEVKGGDGWARLRGGESSRIVAVEQEAATGQPCGPTTAESGQATKVPGHTTTVVSCPPGWLLALARWMEGWPVAFLGGVEAKRVAARPSARTTG